jgi:MYXO-CTERM domain-containing protein
VRRIAWAVLLLALLAAPRAGAVSGSKLLEPGMIYDEVHLNLAAGQRVAWNITATTSLPVIYDLHTHAPGNASQVTDYDKGIFNRSIGRTFTAPVAADYWWFVENGIGNEAYTVTVTAEPEAKPVPGPPLPLALLAGALALALRRR